MKKTVIALLIIFAAGSFVHAEVTVGGQVDMAIVPFQFIINDDAKPQTLYFAGEEDYVMGAGAGRFASNQGPRARLDLRGTSEDDEIGMRARIRARTDGIGIEDYLQAWWKPTDWLRIDAGRFFDDRLRGKINDLDERMSGFNVPMYDGDAIFTRFRTHRYGGQAGLMVSVFLDNVISMERDNQISVGALLYDLNPLSYSSAGTVFDGHPEYVNNNADAYHNIQAAAAWSLKDFMLIRVQYVGAKPQVLVTRVTDETPLTPYTYNFSIFSITAPKIEAAAAFTGFPGLVIDVGGKVPLPFKDWTRPTTDIFVKEDESLITDSLYLIYKNNHIWQAPYQVSLGFKINMEDINFGFGGRVDTKFGGYMKGNKTEMYFGPEINVHVWPSYNLGFAKLIVDFGVEFIGATKNEDGDIIQDGFPLPLNGGTRLGGGISLEKTVSGNCVLKGGVAWKNSGTVNGIKEKMVISVPLFIDWFF